MGAGLPFLLRIQWLPWYPFWNLSSGSQMNFSECFLQPPEFQRHVKTLQPSVEEAAIPLLQTIFVLGVHCTSDISLYLCLGDASL